MNTLNPIPVSLIGHSLGVWSIAFTPDNKSLISADDLGNIIVWNLSTHRQTTSFQTDKEIPAIAFSPDKQLLAIGDRSGILLWDANTFRQIGDLPSNAGGYITSMVFSPDSRILAYAGVNKYIVLWNIKTLQTMGSPHTEHTAIVQSITFSPDGKTLVSGGDDALIMWNLANGRTNRLLGNTSQIRSVAFSSTGILAVGSKLGVGGEQNTLTLWNVSAEQRTVQTLLTSNGEIRHATFSPDGTLVASGGCHEIISAQCTQGELRLWDATASIVSDEPLKLYNKEVRSLAFSPDGLLLAIAVDDLNIYLWNLKTRQQIGTPLRGHTGRIWALAFSSDGSTLASTGDDSTIILWDISDVSKAHQIATLSGHTGRIYSLAFDPKNKNMLVSGGCSQKGLVSKDLNRECTEGEVRFWNTATHQQEGKALIAHNDWVLSLTFSSDGNSLASGSGDDSIIVWNATDRTRKFLLTGHTGDVWSLDFSSDGFLLASGSGGNDRSIIIWEIATLPQMGVSLRGHSGYIRSVVFNSDNTKLLSSASDGTVRQWDISFDFWKKRACNITNRNLSQMEWNRFISSNRAYKRTCKQFPPGEGAPADAP